MPNKKTLTVDEVNLTARDSLVKFNQVKNNCEVIDLPDEIKQSLLFLNEFNRKLFFRNTTILRSNELVKLEENWKNIMNLFVDLEKGAIETSGITVGILKEFFQSLYDNLLEYLKHIGIINVDSENDVKLNVSNLMNILLDHKKKELKILEA